MSRYDKHPSEMTEFEASLDCDIRFYSMPDESIPSGSYDARLSAHMETALREFWRREAAASSRRPDTAIGEGQ